MKLRHLFSRPVLLTAAALTVSSCQHTPKRGLTSWQDDQRDDFFKSELSRIAPELTGRELKQDTSEIVSDSKSNRIYRSQFSAFFLDKADDMQDRERIFFIRMEGKPVNEGRDVEVTVYTGHGKNVPVEQYPDRKPIMVAGSFPVTITNGIVFKPLDEKLYRRQVTPLEMSPREG